MSIFSFKINNNILFTPAILIFLTLVTYLVSTQEFKDVYYSYSIILAASLVIYTLKSFILTFASVEKFLSIERWFLVLINLLFFTAGISSVWLATRGLVSNTFIRDSMGWFFLANLGFYIQSFLTKVPKVLWLSIFSAALYSGVFIVLFLAVDIFIGQSDRLISFQQIVAYLSLILEFGMLMRVGRFFVKKEPKTT